MGEGQVWSMGEGGVEFHFAKFELPISSLRSDVRVSEQGSLIHYILSLCSSHNPPRSFSLEGHANLTPPPQRKVHQRNNSRQKNRGRQRSSRATPHLSNKGREEVGVLGSSDSPEQN